MDIHGISLDIPCIYQAYAGGLQIRGIYQAYARHIPKIGVPDAILSRWSGFQMHGGPGWHLASVQVLKAQALLVSLSLCCSSGTIFVPVPGT